jgi:glycosyltransferase involved in cell wall biosynthesis
MTDFDGDVLVLADMRNQDELFQLARKNIQFDFYFIPHSFKDLRNPLKIAYNAKKLFKSVISKKLNLVVQIMPSPYDLLVDIAAKASGIPIVRMIHDSNTHLGELWPNSNAIKRRLKLATEVIVFSEYVRGNIDLHQKKASILPLPSTLVLFQNSVTTLEYNLEDDVQAPRILLIGRLQKYKGLDTLLKAFSMGDCGTLVVAGAGDIKNVSLPKNAILINRWLSDAEFNYLIDKSEILIFPYIDASQSGTIPIAISRGKTVIISNSGGLAEQTGNYPYAISSEAGDPVSLYNAIKKGIEISTKLEANRIWEARSEQSDPFYESFLGYINERV